MNGFFAQQVLYNVKWVCYDEVYGNSIFVLKCDGDDILNKEMLKGTVDILILSVLKQGDNYGYEISKIIKARTGGLFEILEATLYLALKRLEAQKAIDFYWGDETGGGRRKYFKITESGKAQLAQLISDWKETSQLVDKFI